jgi:hypothetical protein
MIVAKVLMSSSSFTLILPMHIIYFLHLLSTNHKCIQPCYFPMPHKPASQKLKKVWRSTIWSSRWVIAPGQFPMELWCLFAAMLLRVLDLVFCKTLFGNRYYILWQWLFCIYFLNGRCVNLIPGHTYYEYSVWVLKLGMTEWYHIHVDRRNAILVRRVLPLVLF